MKPEKPNNQKILHDRQDKRFRPSIPTFVKLRSGSEEDIGQLIEISRGGLSIQYFINEEKTRTYSELDIFTSDADFAIKAVPIQNISDGELRGLPFETEIIRRHGIKFEEMTEEQNSQLDYFLANYISDEV